MTFLLPFRLIFAGLVLHFFTQKFRRQIIKELIIKFWSQIPPAPVVEKA